MILSRREILRLLGLSQLAALFRPPMGRPAPLKRPATTAKAEAARLYRHVAVHRPVVAILEGRTAVDAPWRELQRRVLHGTESIRFDPVTDPKWRHIHAKVVREDFVHDIHIRDLEPYTYSVRVPSFTWAPEPGP